jgi:hypothetical protein
MRRIAAPHTRHFAPSRPYTDNFTWNSPRSPSVRR